jgi:hypothetical protein
MEARWLRNPRSLKGTGIVFVGSRGADVYVWDTRHISNYEVRPRAGSLACGRPRSFRTVCCFATRSVASPRLAGVVARAAHQDLLAALATDELDPKLVGRVRGPDAGKVAAQLVYGERRMAVVFIEQR